MLAGTDGHLTWLSPVILNLESMGLTHLESEIRMHSESLMMLIYRDDFVISTFSLCHL